MERATGKKQKDGSNKILGKLEQEILDSLWEKGGLSGKEIHGSIKNSREVALTTVLTVIERLVKKGIVLKDKAKGIYVYKPAFSKDEFAKEFSQEIFRDIFEISASGAAASFIDLLADTDPAELETLSGLIEAKKKELERKRRLA